MANHPLRGESDLDDATRGDIHTKAKNGIVGTNSDVSGPAPAGSAGGNGVFGFSKVPSASGVFGSHDGFGAGVSGFSIDGSGLAGVSTNGDAARGDTHAGAKANGLVGTNDGIGPVLAGQPGGNGVFGFSKVPDASASGVAGGHDGVGNGVTGFSQAGSGVSGVSASGIGVVGQGGTLAGRFIGNVEIAGDLTILNGKDIRLADFAEDFDVSRLEEIEPGSVVVLDDEGSVQQSRAAYDHKVAGVVSGAGNFRSAITLDRHKSPGTRKAIALMGKVYCKVDA